MYYLQPKSGIYIRNLPPPQSKCPSKIHTQKNSPPFRFFSLPPEIRVQILALVVTEPPHISIVIRDRSFNNRQRKRQGKPRSSRPLIDSRRHQVAPARQLGPSRIALLLTCRQAYSEGWKLYYGHNSFRLLPETFQALYETMPARCLQQITSLVIPLHSDRLGIWPLLADLQSLESLHVLTAESRLCGHALQLQDLQRGVETLPRLRHFEITQGWYTTLPSGPQVWSNVMADDHKPLATDISAVKEEINEFLRLR